MSKVLLVTCEHAQWGLPAGVDLGVGDEVLRSQASWDHGALEVAHALGHAFDVPVVAGQFSRLFVDLNRPPDHPDVVPVVCYGAEVPRNRGLTTEQIAARLEAWHAPHWRRVEEAIAAEVAAGRQVVHVASHSFCTLLDPPRRQFDVGLLFDPARPSEDALIAGLEGALARHGLTSRRNEPYQGTGPGLPSAMRLAFAEDAYLALTLETSHAVTMRPGGGAQVAAAMVEGLREFGIVAA